ncbi:MAG: hypothetical protein AABX03_03510 [Nanoarchaeota archaeon]
MKNQNEITENGIELVEDNKPLTASLFLELYRQGNKESIEKKLNEMSRRTFRINKSLFQGFPAEGSPSQQIPDFSMSLTDSTEKHKGYFRSGDMSYNGVKTDEGYIGISFPPQIATSLPLEEDVLKYKSKFEELKEQRENFEDLMSLTDDQLRIRNSNERVGIEVGRLQTTLGDVVLGHLNEFPVIQSVTDRSLSKYQEFWNPKSKVIGKYNQDEALEALDNLEYVDMEM